jgi:hypothetical protein
VQTSFYRYEHVGLSRVEQFPQLRGDASDGSWKREVVQCGAEHLHDYASSSVYAILAFCKLCAGAEPNTFDWTRADIEPYYRCFVTQMLAQGTLTPEGFPDETGFGTLLKETVGQNTANKR